MSSLGSGVALRHHCQEVFETLESSPDEPRTFKPGACGSQCSLTYAHAQPGPQTDQLGTRPWLLSSQVLCRQQPITTEKQFCRFQNKNKSEVPGTDSVGF